MNVVDEVYLDLSQKDIASENKVNLLSPWMIHAKKLHTFFSKDADISMTYHDKDSANPIVKIYVANSLKAECLEKIIKSEVKFGNVTLHVQIIPSNDELSVNNLFQIAFAGNPYYSEFYSNTTPFGTMNYVFFTPNVLQYVTDDTSDLYGIESILAEDVARDIFDNKYLVNFCTDPTDDLQLNWP